MVAEFHVRKLVRGDEETLDAFLAPYTPFIYFMRSNIRKGGVVYEDKPYHADYFGAFANGELKGVIAHHWIGSIQVFVPEKSARATLAMAIAEHLSVNPRNVTIVLGPSEHVRDVCDTLGLAETDFRPGRNHEYLYSLDLAEMKMPELLKNPDILVRPATKEDLSILIPWDHDYLIETTKEQPGPETLKKAPDRITLRTEEGGLFVLEDKGHLISYCGAHGMLSDWKIVGPVWTPVDLRNRGYGRAVTAGSLAILRDKGASHAVLFTESLAAIKAYMALGFREIGEWRLDFLKQPVQSFKITNKTLKNIQEPNIRRLQQHEWKLLKSLRLQALESDPQSFWEDLEEAKCYEDSYWQNLAADLTAPNGSRMFLLEGTGNLHGFVYGIKKDNNECRIGGLWVDPAYRGRGYGNRLVQQVVSWVKSDPSKPSLKLWSPVGPAVSFYERNGFKSLDKIKTHSHDKREVVEMEFTHD